MMRFHIYINNINLSMQINSDNHKRILILLSEFIRILYVCNIKYDYCNYTPSV